MPLAHSPLNFKQLCMLLVLAHGMAQQHHVNVTTLKQVLLQAGSGGHSRAAGFSSTTQTRRQRCCRQLYCLPEPIYTMSKP